MTIVLRYVKPDYINVRRGPSTSAGIAYRLARGTDITVIADNPVKADGWTWLERAKYRGLWVASELLTDAPDVTAKVGWHLLMRNVDYSAVMATLGTASGRGRPVPFMTVVGPDELNVQAIKRASPQTTVVLRVYPGGGSGLGMDARTYWQQCIGPYPDRQRADYHQINNECTDFSPSAYAWWIEQMKQADALGFKLAIWTPPVGTPDTPLYSSPTLHAMLRYARDHAHLVCIHEYEIGAGDYGLYRFCHRAFPQLPSDLRANMPKVAFTEFGVQKMRDMSGIQWLQTVRGYEAELGKYPWVIGAALWSLGDTGAGAAEDWQGDNWANKLILWSQV